MGTDNGRRGSSGVTVSLIEIDPERLRLVFDDVRNLGEPGQGPWDHDVLFTFKDYNILDIKDHKLSDKELADIGFALIARLAALHKHPIR